MKKLVVFLLLLSVITGCKRKQIEKERMCSRIDLERILDLIPISAESVTQLGKSTKNSMEAMLESINNVAQDSRTFANTIRPYDQARFEFLMDRNILSILAKLSNNPEIQLAAASQTQQLDQYQDEVLDSSIVLYQAFSDYSQHGIDVFKKAIATRYFLQKKLQNFKLQGTHLPVAQQVELKQLGKDIEQLASQYRSNIEHDVRKIIVPAKSLKGLSKVFLQTLKKDRRGDYIVPVDQKTFNVVMKECLVEKTRKEFFLAFGQRAYPQNISVLQDLLDARYKFAQKLSIVDFATYQLQPQSLKHTKKVEQFLWSIVYELQKHEEHEFQSFVKELPPSVVLTKDHKIKPWDVLFVHAYYKKRHFSLTKNMAEFFELHTTMQSMFKLFHKLFHIEFEFQQVPEGSLWSDDVMCYRIRSLDNQSILGYIFFDLFKREGKKIKEVAHLQFVPTIKDDCSISCVGASVVSGSFNQATEEQPTLLGVQDVKALFKEIGSSLHDLFGATCYVDFSGTQVSKDFSTVSEQLLEMWLDDQEVLHSISQHYKTGHKLSKDMIAQMKAAVNFDQSYQLLHKAFIALVSLAIHKEGGHKDIHKTIEKLYKKVFKHVAYNPHSFIEYNTLALGLDGALAYTPIWSKVMAADLYNHMKNIGMKYEIGKEYSKHILSPGGFGAPMVMMKKFLKRAPNSQAFLDRLNNNYGKL